MSSQMTSSLTQTWVPVTDAQGRTRLEAHWTSAAPAPTHTVHAA